MEQNNGRPDDGTSGAADFEIAGCDTGIPNTPSQDIPAVEGDGPTNFYVTYFKNHLATTLTTETLTLPDLASRMQNASAKTKAKLPWVKLAEFGKDKSDKGCLRIDQNVKAITGIEIDYDIEVVSFEAAVKAIRDLNIKAVLYTSSSHTLAAPRWRVLAVTSKAQPPEMRAVLVRRLNGALKNKLNVTEIAKSESFTLSQSYYYGWVNNNPDRDHRSIAVDGEFIDLRTDLAQYEATGGPCLDAGKKGYGTGKGPGKGKGKGKSSGAGNANSNDEGYESSYSFEEILGQMGDSTEFVVLRGFNDPLSRSAAKYVAMHNGNPFDKERLKTLLRDAIKNAPKKATRKQAAIDRYLGDGYLDGIIESAEQKFVQKGPLALEDFVAVMQSGNYLFIPTRELWPTKSVNACLPPIPVLKSNGMPVLNDDNKPVMMLANTWMDKNQRVEQISWAPGFDEIIKDRLVADGGWIDRPGVSIFNLYRPPTLNTEDVMVPDIKPWFDHIKLIYPDDYEHIIKVLAHRCQKPFEKINHNLLLGGSQGIGKDTLLEPVKYAVGPWNFREINPSDMLGTFNPHLRSVVLRISEARDLGEVNRFGFYEHLKTITAAPPDVLRVNEKNLKEHYIFNCCGVITTTNHKTGGIYLPPDDRRTYVAWSNSVKEEYADDYWKGLWGWLLENDGIKKVAAYLRTYDLSSFNPKSPPKKTPAFFEIAASGVSSEEIELSDLIERMGNPDALTIPQSAEPNVYIAQAANAEQERSVS